MIPSAVSFRTARQGLIDNRDLHGDAFCAALAAAADDWLAVLLDNAAGGDERGVALVAVGGYGRGELFPYSDLDVVLVHRGRRDISRVADLVWYPLWDEGIRLDHSVRKPDEVLGVARNDLRAQLGLLDARVVAGDAGVAEHLISGALDLWRERAGIWMAVLADVVAARHAEQGDVAFLLEPDLKEARGGLRDINVVRAAALAVPAIGAQVDLSALDGPRRTLTEARVELHRLTQRASDRLLLQEQDQVAAALGYADADALMASISEAGRTIAWVADDAWRRRHLWSPRGRRGRRRPSPLEMDQELAEPAHTVVEPAVAIAEAAGGAEVVLAVEAPVADDVTLPMRIAALAAERRLPIGRGTLEVLAEKSPGPPDPWPGDLRAALVRVLAAGPPAIDALEALEQRRLLSRLIPEWEEVRNRPQRNAYHRYTVDRHLLEAATGAAAHVGQVSRPDLLLLGVLLHDIGKGFPGDHTKAGMEVVERIARRMGLPDDDVAVLVSMVRLHLLLPDVATRRDLDDPVTVASVADAVGDVETLELLAALTEADSLATGPAAWGSWKAGLVADLVSRVRASLVGESAGVPAMTVNDAHQRLMAEVKTTGRTAVVAELPTVTVVASDRPGLLAAVTGVLALRGLDVRSANVMGDEEMAVEVFTVEQARGRWPDWSVVATEIDATLAGALALGPKLAEQSRLYSTRRPAAALKSSTTVTVDNSASATSTVIDVRTTDVVGLLHRVTTALFDQGLDVTAARVSTLGHDVLDAFYVRDGRGAGKVEDQDRLDRIVAAVRLAADSMA